jgi:thioredoxin-like negative regulator of GroEL
MIAASMPTKFTLPVVLEFGAPWCIPCHALEPFLNELQARSDVLLVKVNVDVDYVTAERYGVQSLPTVIVFDSNGECVDTLIGGKVKKQTVMGILAKCGVVA